MQKEKERVEFDQFPNPSTFAFWKLNFWSEVCSGSRHPSHAMIWLSEIASAKEVYDSRTSGSILGTNLTNYETLNATIVNSLKKTRAAIRLAERYEDSSHDDPSCLCREL